MNDEMMDETLDISELSPEARAYHEEMVSLFWTAGDIYGTVKNLRDAMRQKHGEAAEVETKEWLRRHGYLAKVVADGR